MRIHLTQEPDEFQQLQADWNGLVGRHPFRRWEWAARWWEVYASPRTELFVVAALAEDRLVGLAPWFLDRQAIGGRTIRPLGSGEVCTDHLDLYTTPDYAQATIASIAQWLIQKGSSDESIPARWDILDFDYVSEHSDGTLSLVEKLEQAGCSVHRRPTHSQWRLELPDTWEAYLAGQTKSRRKRLRKWERAVREGSLQFQTSSSEATVTGNLNTLIDLHQRRRQSLGEPGAFHSEAFTRFVSSVVQDLYPLGQAQLARLDQGGRPISCDLTFSDENTLYLYQSGLDPNALDISPGNVNTVHLILEAFKHSLRTIDFLRGDEAYKKDWGATAVRAIQCRVAATHPVAQLRQTFWLAGSRMKDWIRSQTDRTSS